MNATKRTVFLAASYPVNRFKSLGNGPREDFGTAATRHDDVLGLYRPDGCDTVSYAGMAEQWPA
ncbi:MAG: hypothetical protein ACRDRT_07415, partial [Pseudonocardiaceae bacterium]